MVATEKVPPPGQAETQDTVGLTRWQKAIGICLLFFYLAMIAITIATLMSPTLQPKAISNEPLGVGHPVTLAIDVVSLYSLMGR